MNLNCDAAAGHHLQSRSQQVRVITEAWFASQGYCIACSSDRVVASKPDAIVSDFVCPCCAQSSELKSSRSVPYRTMLKRIASQDPPAWILMQYVRDSTMPAASWQVFQLTAIHPVYLTSAVIEPRKPLELNARRQDGRVAISASTGSRLKG